MQNTEWSHREKEKLKRKKNEDEENSGRNNSENNDYKDNDNDDQTDKDDEDYYWELNRFIFEVWRINIPRGNKCKDDLILIHQSFIQASNNSNSKWNFTYQNFELRTTISLESFEWKASNETHD